MLCASAAFCFLAHVEIEWLSTAEWPCHICGNAKLGSSTGTASSVSHCWSCVVTIYSYYSAEVCSLPMLSSLTGIHVNSGTYRAKEAIELQPRLLCFWSIADAGLVISVRTASAFVLSKECDLTQAARFAGCP